MTKIAHFLEKFAQKLPKIFSLAPDIREYRKREHEKFQKFGVNFPKIKRFLSLASGVRLTFENA